ncbi:MAG: polysaccharide deacetylase family protein [Actinobacteria bacterium]|nr:MAG: polysaccharide deacetylase family protein [Actinomycetota bacterium]
MRKGRVLLVAALLLAVAGSASGNAATPRGVPILMYHVVSAPPGSAHYPDLFVRPDDFAKQMGWLAKHGYRAVTLKRVYDSWTQGANLPAHPVVISFDDGYLSQYTRALPVLRTHHWPGVLNMEVNFLHGVGALVPWRVRKLIDAGWELDAHTLTHPDLTTLDDAELWRQVHGSRVALRRLFHVPVDFFCYPAGRYDARVINAVKLAGFLGATTTNYGLARPPGLFTLNRIRINGSDGLSGFASKLTNLTP